MAPPPPTRNSFEVAIICALPLEHDAVSHLVDEFWGDGGDLYGRGLGDTNSYRHGRMGSLDIVLLLLPEMGKASAASAAASLRSSYPNIRLAILAGVCGGVPNPRPGQDIFLGDVLIGKIVVQYDLGRRYPDKFVPRDALEDSLGRLPVDLRSMVRLLETERGLSEIEQQTASFLKEIQSEPSEKQREKSYQYPGIKSDRLFQPSYRHKHHPQTQCVECNGGNASVCDESREKSCDELGCAEENIVRRERLQTTEEFQPPSIFIGNIGSGDTVLKSGEDRDQIAKDHQLLGFEMESAGIWSTLPCIVIKGVCDYADCHKNKTWQHYAAATAASTTKALLQRYQPINVNVCQHRMNEIPLQAPDACQPFQARSDAPIKTSSLDGHVNSAQDSRSLKRQVIIPFPRNEDVVDRPDLFKALNQLLPETNEYSCAALWGLGGSGKTQIALEYAYSRAHRNPNIWVFWIHADNETSFIQDCKKISEELGLDRGLDGKTLLRATFNKIKQQAHWLLVLDNVDNLALFGVGHTSKTSESLLDYLPTNGTGSILWTSRDERIVGTLVSTQRGVPIISMRNEEAMKLLEKTADERFEGKSLQDAIKLLSELQSLPLAVSQAGAYMRRTRTSVEEYLSSLRQSKNRWDLLKETQYDRHRRPNVSNSILETWSMSVDHLRQESEVIYKVLNVLAYLDNQHISTQLISEAANYGSSLGGLAQNQNEVNLIIARLRDFSFLTARKAECTGPSFEMHMLVQEGLQYSLRAKHQEIEPERLKQKRRHRISIALRRSLHISKRESREQAETSFLDVALDIVFRHVSQSDDVMAEEQKKYMTHAMRLTNWAEICSKKSKMIELLNLVSDYLESKHRWRECEKVLSKLLKICQESYSEKDLKSLDIMQKLVWAYCNQSLYGEAEKLATQVLNLRRDILGGTHWKTITSMQGLAYIYCSQGRHNQAETLAMEALQISKQVFGKLNVDTAPILSNLAWVYHAQGQYAKAEQCFFEVLGSQREAQGEENGKAISTLEGIVLTYTCQGRHDEAEETLSRAIDLSREVRGEDCIETILMLLQMAGIYMDQEKYSQSIAAWEDGLEKWRKAAGERHPRTINPLRILGSAYTIQEQHEKAEDALTEALGLQEEWFGPNDPQTFMIMTDLAKCRYKQGRLNDAVEILQDCRQRQRIWLGAEHEDTKFSEETIEAWTTEMAHISSHEINHE